MVVDGYVSGNEIGYLNDLNDLWKMNRLEGLNAILTRCGVESRPHLVP